jgi:hypothetical protein
MKQKGKMLILALVILTALTITSFLLIYRGKSNNLENIDFYVSKFAPQSLAYFDCKTKGMTENSLCAQCEQLFNDTFSKQKELSLNDTQQVIAYVKNLNNSCVNLKQGGN